jgi:hypothetical protein
VYAAGALIPATGNLLSGIFSVTIPNPGTDRLYIQVVDAAGNVGRYSGKGSGLQVIQVNSSDVTFKEGPATLTATVPSFGNLAAPVNYYWTFGDGGTAFGTVPGTSFSVDHQFYVPSTSYTAKVRVTDFNGAVGSKRITLTYYCQDPAGDTTTGQADLVRCRVIKNGPNMTIRLTTKDALAAPAVLSSRLRYSVALKVGATTTTLSYRNGSASGLAGLTVVVGAAGPTDGTSGPATDHDISFTFPLSGIGSPLALTWSAKTEKLRDDDEHDGYAPMDAMPNSPGILSFP